MNALPKQRKRRKTHGNRSHPDGSYGSRPVPVDLSDNTGPLAGAFMLGFPITPTEASAMSETNGQNGYQYSPDVYKRGSIPFDATKRNQKYNEHASEDARQKALNRAAASELRAKLQAQAPHVASGRELFDWLKARKDRDLWQLVEQFGKVRNFDPMMVKWTVHQVAEVLVPVREVLAIALPAEPPTNGKPPAPVPAQAPSPAPVPAAAPPPAAAPVPHPPNPSSQLPPAPADMAAQRVQEAGIRAVQERALRDELEHVWPRIATGLGLYTWAHDQPNLFDHLCRLGQARGFPSLMKDWHLEQLAAALDVARDFLGVSRAQATGLEPSSFSTPASAPLVITTPGPEPEAPTLRVFGEGLELEEEPAIAEVPPSQPATRHPPPATHPGPRARAEAAQAAYDQGLPPAVKAGRRRRGDEPTNCMRWVDAEIQSFERLGTTAGRLAAKVLYRFYVELSRQSDGLPVDLTSDLGVAIAAAAAAAAVAGK